MPPRHNPIESYQQVSSIGDKRDHDEQQSRDHMRYDEMVKRHPGPDASMKHSDYERKYSNHYERRAPHSVHVNSSVQNTLQTTDAKYGGDDKEAYYE